MAYSRSNHLGSMVLITFTILLFFCEDIGARLCQTEQLGLIKNGTQSISNSKPNSTSSFLFSCPKPEDPLHFTECCDSVTEGHQGSYCCEKRAHEFISGLDDRILIAVSIGVIIACLLFSMIVLVCCFWNKCPMYSTCRSSYQHNDTITFSTKEEMMKLNGMPNEDYNLHNESCELSTVKIRPVLDA